MTKTIEQNQLEVTRAEDGLLEALGGNQAAKYLKLTMTALGSIPWVGGTIAAAAAVQSEKEQKRVNHFLAAWLDEHERKFEEVVATIREIIGRLDQLGPEVEARVQSDEYLGLVRKGFRIWDEASSEEKRKFVRRLLTNAGGKTLCSDDVLRLFLDWVQRYDELHFAVMRVVYKCPGATRGAIWRAISGEVVREDAAEADLFRLLVDNLSQGRVMRQHRPVNAVGQFVSRPRGKTGSQKTRGAPLKSAFSNQDPYELTSLGSQFVHYVMEDLAPQIGEAERDAG